MLHDWPSKVKQVVEEVIHKPIPNPEQNLFDSGLIDSLSAVGVLVTLEEKLGVTLDVLDFARREDFTLSHIAALVAAADAKNRGAAQS